MRLTIPGGSLRNSYQHSRLTLLPRILKMQAIAIAIEVSGVLGGVKAVADVANITGAEIRTALAEVKPDVIERLAESLDGLQ